MKLPTQLVTFLIRKTRQKVVLLEWCNKRTNSVRRQYTIMSKHKIIYYSIGFVFEARLLIVVLVIDYRVMQWEFVIFSLVPRKIRSAVGLAPDLSLHSCRNARTLRVTLYTFMRYRSLRWDWLPWLKLGGSLMTSDGYGQIFGDWHLASFIKIHSSSWLHCNWNLQLKSQVRSSRGNEMKSFISK